MIAQDLITAARQQADDMVLPYLVQDANWIFWLNEAISKAARRSELFVDSTTPQTCQLTFAPGVQSMTVDPTVHLIQEIYVSTPSQPSLFITPIGAREFAVRQRAWKMTPPGQPIYVVFGQQARAVFLWPAPVDGATVNMRVKRGPLTKIATVTDALPPELIEDYQYPLISWMLYRFFTTQDAQVDSSAKARSQKDLFDEAFPDTMSVSDDIWMAGQAGYMMDGRG